MLKYNHSYFSMQEDQDSGVSHLLTESKTCPVPVPSIRKHFMIEDSKSEVQGKQRGWQLISFATWSSEPSCWVSFSDL